VFGAPQILHFDLELFPKHGREVQELSMPHGLVPAVLLLELHATVDVTDHEIELRARLRRDSIKPSDLRGLRADTMLALLKRAPERPSVAGRQRLHTIRDPLPVAIRTQAEAPVQASARRQKLRDHPS